MPFRPLVQEEAAKPCLAGEACHDGVGPIENCGWTFSACLGGAFMKVLHLCKTSRGGRWASAQARVLTQGGFEVHVALPDLDGPVTSEWIANGAQVHRIDYTLSPHLPVATISSLNQVRRIVDLIRP